MLQLQECKCCGKVKPIAEFRFFGYMTCSSCRKLKDAKNVAKHQAIALKGLPNV